MPQLESIHEVQAFFYVLGLEFQKGQSSSRILGIVFSRKVDQLGESSPYLVSLISGAQIPLNDYIHVHRLQRGSQWLYGVVGEYLQCDGERPRPRL